MSVLGGKGDLTFECADFRFRPAADISKHFIFRSRSLIQPYQSAYPSGYYDAYLGGGHEKATISVRSGWCGGVMAYGGGSAAAAQDHRLPPRRRAPWIPMVASLERRLPILFAVGSNLGRTLKQIGETKVVKLAHRSDAKPRGEMVGAGKCEHAVHSFWEKAGGVMADIVKLNYFLADERLEGIRPYQLN